ncbi:NCK-interacting protein with SH3 domain-like, partial [Nilaparvata lugens]|uniref:NCK-interacting protein with SH3 domain-like n=1 Tax=Nilaparvata lugens TaxID=108931 RepID=UPI00193CF203
FHTELSYEMSRVAVGVVVSNLLQLLPPTATPPLETLLGQLRGGAECEGPPVQLLDQSHDAERLAVVLGELVACKEDAQQRSWELYEDEDAIMEYLQEFTSIIKNADPAISRRVLSRDKCWQLETLLDYYQMEVRWSIRSLLLDAFLAVCALHRTFVHLFLNSVLPVELARDMQSNVKDVPKLINSAKLLTVILSMGEPMPIPHLEQLGEEFVDFLLSLIEDPPDRNEQISEEFFVVLVSYNLQFPPQAPNIVVEAFAQRTYATNFTEKLLFMLNREDDPVRAITQQVKYPNSVLKLIVDIFVSRKAANLFYTNDINVLIDIIVRQLTDLSPGDEKRSQYLQLCRLVLRNTDYAESQHRCDDLHKCFIHIFCEEAEASRPDQALVRDISNEFPHYFKT